MFTEISGGYLLVMGGVEPGEGGAQWYFSADHRALAVSDFVEEFYCEVYVDHYLAAFLDDGGAEDGVFEVLGSGVGDAEECLDAVEAVDVAFLCLGCGRGGGGELSQ